MGGGCPVHVLSAYVHVAADATGPGDRSPGGDLGIVLAQAPIVAPAGADRGEAELTVALALLGRIAWPGRVLTGDALFCQRALCRQVRDAGGHDFLAVCLLYTSPSPRDS